MMTVRGGAAGAAGCAFGCKKLPGGGATVLSAAEL